MSRGPLPSLGAELEMVVIDATGASACVSEGYFEALRTIRNLKASNSVERIDGITLAVHSDIGVNGIDNGFNLLETAHAPIAAGYDGLTKLAVAIRRDLSEVLHALRADGFSLTSLAQHPTAGTGPSQYKRVVAPRPIYRYLTSQRGWNHAAGIDAKAQNGPTTGLSVDNSINALNLLLATSPAFISLFANSPFEGGQLSGLMETRMTLWPRMVSTSHIAADRDIVGLPPRWFSGLDDYFAWTFAPGSVMHAIPLKLGSYKSAAEFFVVGDGKTNAVDFFRGEGVEGLSVGSGKRKLLSPSAYCFEALQWSNFLDFRLRFAFGSTGPSADDIAHAFGQEGGFEILFRKHATTLYLENRCAGATFPDSDLAAIADPSVLDSCIISASALQAGLVMASASEGGAVAATFLRRWPIETIHQLRDDAIRHALSSPQNPALIALCSEVLALAREHLPAPDRKYLAYAEWVLSTRQTAAQRAIEHWRRLGKPALDTLARERRVKL